MASLYLNLLSDEDAEITLKYSLFVRDNNDKIVAKFAMGSFDFDDEYADASGAHNFCKKETLR